MDEMKKKIWGQVRVEAWHSVMDQTSSDVWNYIWATDSSVRTEIRAQTRIQIQNEIEEEIPSWTV